MKPLVLDEIVDLETYGHLRKAYRQSVIALKRDRRLAVGPALSLVFENRETLCFQVQEMLWVERIVDPERAQHELDVYNELMPGDSDLSATLFVEIPDLDEIKPALDRLVGIDEHVLLVLGDGAEAEALRARFDPRQMEEDRISAVQYIRFPLTAAQNARFSRLDVPARIEIDHPNYGHNAALPEALRRSLIADLDDRSPGLLVRDQISAPSRAEDEVVLSTETARALRPARPRAEAHVIVEPLAPVASLLEADAELLAELMELVRRVAREICAQHGSCRVETEVGAGERRLRWHVLGPRP